MSYVEQLRRQKQLEHYQENDPWGKDQADAIAEFGTNVMEGVVGGVTDWWKRSSADQEGWFDDALRLAAGGVKNVAAAAEDQEGYLDDALRLVGGGVKNTLNVLGAPGYVGGKIGGAAIGALGGDRRLGEWGGGFAGDIILGGYAAKGLKVARAGTQYARLSPFQRALQYGSTSGAMESAVTTLNLVDHALGFISGGKLDGGKGNRLGDRISVIHNENSMAHMMMNPHKAHWADGVGHELGYWGLEAVQVTATLGWGGAAKGGTAVLKNAS